VIFQRSLIREFSLIAIAVVGVLLAIILTRLLILLLGKAAEGAVVPSARSGQAACVPAILEDVRKPVRIVVRRLRSASCVMHVPPRWHVKSSTHFAVTTAAIFATPLRREIPPFY
jgi:hypothetical protein